MSIVILCDLRCLWLMMMNGDETILLLMVWGICFKVILDILIEMNDLMWMYIDIYWWTIKCLLNELGFEIKLLVLWWCWHVNFPIKKIKSKEILRWLNWWNKLKLINFVSIIIQYRLVPVFLGCIHVFPYFYTAFLFVESCFSFSF